MVKSACGIEAVYMCFNGTGIWGGETLLEKMVPAFFRFSIPLLLKKREKIDFGTHIEREPNT